MRFLAPAVLFLLALWACQLSQNPKVDDTADFDPLYDSLARFDSVVIVFNDPQGNLLDTVFQGKVDSHSKIRDLEVKGWDGGKADIVISGFDAGELVYQLDKKFDGTTNQTDVNTVILTPDAAISSDVHDLQMAEGDSLKYPPVAVSPASLSDKTLLWTSSDTIVAMAGRNGIKALKAGNAVLTAHLKSAPAIQFAIGLTVSPPGLLPVPVGHISFPKDTLELLVGGSPESLIVSVMPPEANQAVSFSVSDPAKVALQNGKVAVSAPGFFSVFAVSAANPNAKDTLYLEVIAPAVDDTVPPSKPLVSVAPKGPTHERRPTWNWVSGGNGGAGWYQYKLDDANFSTGVISTTDTMFRPSIELNPGVRVLYVRERDSAGNWSAAGSAQVEIDTTAPNAPVIGGASPTNSLPRWTWASGGGGAGYFRYRLGDADFPSGAAESRDTSYTLSGATSGTTYALYVEERDAAGNWSAPAQYQIKYDLTKPILALTSPAFTGTLYTQSASVSLAGTVSGPSPITTLTYAVGSGAPTPVPLSAGTWSIAGIALTEGAQANVTLTATDSVGNTGTLMVPILMDNASPGAPVFVVAPTSPIKAVTGAWTWSAASDGTGGSGLNGHFRYALNSGAWKDTTGLGAADLSLAEGNNVLALQEQDRAGNWSASATSLVKVDLTAPALSILSHANPATITSTHLTFTVSATDTGSGVQSVTVSGQTAGSGVLANSAGIWTSADLTLKGGSNSLVVTATDQVGNSRNLAFTVNVSVPAANVKITNPADNNTLTNADSIDISYTIDGTAGKKRFGLAEGVNILTISSPPNASGATGKDSVKVVRDATPPNAPSVSVIATNTNGTATWTWSSKGDNAGGAGIRAPHVYRYSFDGGATWTSTALNSVSQTAEGVYTLIAQEQDLAGNWSVSSEPKTISVDKTAPVVTIQTPDNYITNLDSVKISYTEQDSTKPSVAKTKWVKLPTDHGANTVTISSTADAAGNIGTASITVYRRSEVVFVKASASGSGDGSSWDNAAGGLESGIAKAGDGGQIWLAAGTYKPSSASGFVIRKGVAIFGGFATAGTAYTVAQRDSTIPYKTILSSAGFANDTLVKVQNIDETQNIGGFSLNSVQVSGWGSIGLAMLGSESFQIRNCVFQQFSMAILAHYVTGIFANCAFQQNSGAIDILDIWLSIGDPNGIAFQDCIFQNNSLDIGNYGGGMIVYISNLGNATFKNCYFLDDIVSQNDQTFHLRTNDPYPEAVVTFTGSTVLGGLSKISHGGTLNYVGLGNTPPN